MGVSVSDVDQNAVTQEDNLSVSSGALSTVLALAAQPLLRVKSERM